MRASVVASVGLSAVFGVLGVLLPAPAGAQPAPDPGPQAAAAEVAKAEVAREVEPDDEPNDQDVAISANGLYPLWEQTAVSHESGTGQVSYGHAQIAYGRVQLGTQPALDLYGTLNLQLKLGLFESRHHRVAVIAGAYRLPREAEARTIGDLHSSGFANPYGPLALFPLAMAHSWVATSRLRVHSAATLLLRRASQELDRRPSGGLAVLLDWRASGQAVVRAHVGARGIGADEIGHGGLSFCITTEHALLAAGYVRSVTRAGQSHGDFLFDAGFLFR
jgi:hypothetical protein